jgi:hypothetical protein
MNNPQIILGAAIAAVWLGGAASAENRTSVTASVRGGYDANPQLEPGAHGVSFFDIDVLAGVATERNGVRLGAAGQAQRREYEGELSADETYKLAVLAATELEGLTFSALSQAEYARGEDFRAFDAFERFTVKREQGAVQPFAALEFRYTTLNEKTDIFTGGFLDESLRFFRVSFTPGAAIVHKTDRGGAWRAGAAANVSTDRYQDKDILGSNRDNERFRPLVFASYAEDGFSLYVSGSQLYGDWSSNFFRPVDRTLFEGSASYKQGAYTIALNVLQTPQETTFLLSPLIIVTLLEAKLTAALDEKQTLTAFARDLDAAYLSTGFEAEAQIYGLRYAHALDNGLEAQVELARLFGETIGGEDADGARIVFGITQKLEGGLGQDGLLGDGKTSTNALRRERPGG